MGLNLGNSSNGSPVAQAGTLESIRSEKDTIDANLPNVKAMAEAAKARKAAETAAGTNANAAGAQQQSMAKAQIGMGTGLGITGGVTTSMGVTKQAAGDAMLASATAFGVSSAAGAALKASGTMMVTIGTGLITSGVGMVAQGVVTLASANENIQKGTQHLAKAAQEGIISKEQSKIANTEMIRSQIFETKISMLESTMLEMQDTGKLKGATGEDLSQEEIEKIKAGGKEMFDKAFDAGADALANNGIMSLKDGDDTRYFMLNKDGNPAEINVQMGDDGKPKLDNAGRLQVDENNPVLAANDLSDDQSLTLKFNFAIMNQMKDMITGSPAVPDAVPPKEEQPALARIEIDPNTGEVKAGSYHLDNPQQLKEFAAIAHAASQNPPPLRYSKDDNGDLYFQKWDWDKNIATGDKVSIKEMSGGNVDKSDPDWLTKAKTTAEAAFKKAGLGSDSDIYKLLQPLAAQSANNDAHPIKVSDYKNYWDNQMPQVGGTGNNSNSSLSFGNNSNRLSFA